MKRPYRRHVLPIDRFEDYGPENGHERRHFDGYRLWGDLLPCWVYFLNSNDISATESLGAVRGRENLRCPGGRRIAVDQIRLGSSEQLECRGTQA